MVRPLHIKNARIWSGNGAEVRDLYTTDVVQAAPAHDALVVDLEGYTIFPGLINAHDHLELNHYPRTKFREVYNNAHEWGEDVHARLNESPFKELRAYPLWDRLFIGGLKNLLCGATTVAHHNPPHKELFRKDFPVRVLRKYGWAHSLHFSTDEEIVASYRSTPKDAPWFIHLAEGTDEVAAGEYRRLKALGCVQQNTVIVHGVGLTQDDISDAAPCVRGLVWCPTTNKYLLGKSASGNKNIRAWRKAGGIVAIGSDSRLTAEIDLQFEVLVVESTDDYSLRSATQFSATVLGLADVGHLKPSAWADWHMWRLGKRACFRADLALIVKGGVPQIGDPEVMAKFPHVRTVGATLDGRPKAIHLDLARRIHKCQLKERGLDVEALPRGRVFGRN